MLDEEPELELLDPELLDPELLETELVELLDAELDDPGVLLDAPLLLGNVLLLDTMGVDVLVGCVIPTHPANAATGALTSSSKKLRRAVNS